MLLRFLRNNFPLNHFYGEPRNVPFFCNSVSSDSTFPSSVVVFLFICAARSWTFFNKASGEGSLVCAGALCAGAAEEAPCEEPRWEGAGYTCVEEGCCFSAGCSCFFTSAAFLSSSFPL